MPRPDQLQFLADENIAPEAVAFLRSRGTDAVSVRDRGFRARPDEEVLAVATAEQRVVLSQDLDFGALAVAHGSPCYGIVLLRPGDLVASEVVRLLGDFLRADLDLAPPFLVVLEPGSIRVRSLA